MPETKTYIAGVEKESKSWSPAAGPVSLLRLGVRSSLGTVVPVIFGPLLVSMKHHIEAHRWSDSRKI